MKEQIPALIVDPRDNVATILKDGLEGWTIKAGEHQFTLIQAVPFGHKVSITSIRAGEVVVKYGSPIGIASRDIEAGEHVHVHNVIGHRQGLRGDKNGQ
jgi:altronate dehydratase small subunit